MVTRVLAALLLGLAVAPAAALFEPPTERVLADGTYRLTEPLHVGPGEVVVVRNATLLLDVRGAVPAVLLDGGTLRVERSRLDTSLPPADGGWFLVGKRGTLDLRDSVVTRHAQLAMELPGPAPSRIASTTFTHGGGLSFIRGANVDVRGTLFEDVTSGIAIRDASGALEDNVFRRVTGPGRAIDVQSTSAGEKTPLATRPRVERNLVEDSHWGMLNLNGWHNVIRDNAFRNNTVGLTVAVPHGQPYLRTQAPLVEGNVFDGNHASIVVGLAAREAGAPDAEVPLHGNAFLGTRCTHVLVPERADVRVVVDATGNWWGSPDGPGPDAPGCPAVTPGVLVAPWLNAWRGG